MRLALIGHGSMGQLLAARARNSDDEVGVIITSQDAGRGVDALANDLRGHDVAIDFSVAGAVLRNVDACARAGVPLVEGTTGWYTKEAEAAVRAIIDEHNGALVHGSNFSVGVNLFYRVVEHAAALFSSAEDYAPFIEEAHHARKRDAPSGTAVRLRELMNKHLRREIPVTSTRAGFIPGTHRIGFDSAADQITLTHTARSREGFAAGALLTARWIVGRHGLYEFSEVINEILVDS